jgi:signal transduction histidine kinase
MVIAAMVWISVLVLRLEAQAQHQQLMRLALWRMDAWLSPLLRDEGNRPYFEYLPFYPQERAYTKILNAIEPGEVYSPSPLLTFDSELFPLHFQMSAAGEITSPQAPSSNWRDLAESQYVNAEFLSRKESLLRDVIALLRPVGIEACVAQAQSTFATLMGSDGARASTLATLGQPPPGSLAPEPPPLSPSPARQSIALQDESAQKAMSKADLQWRMGSKYAQQEAGNVPMPQMQQQMLEANDHAAQGGAQVQVGALVPVWLATRDSELSQDAHSLMLIRRVQIGEQAFHQGILVDWKKLKEKLAAQVADLFNQVRLTPVALPTMIDVESGRMLGSIPALVDAPCAAMAAGPLITPARTVLGVTWLAVALAVVAAGGALRSSIHFGEKRARFASAVTHELRTPLTTFRMYSDMLAEGMIRDDAQRDSYLQTLKTESSRLATLVENVLSYARLEDGRHPSKATRTTIGEIFQRIEGVLRRRAADAGMELRVENGLPNAPITVDVEAVGQILFNLVDNACKYANGSVDRTIHLEAKGGGDNVVNIAVRDHGPGIAPEYARRIFAPFDRGAHKPGDTIPGVGLGLALARGLARDLGGDLRLLNSPNGAGAAFIVSLPLPDT